MLTQKYKIIWNRKKNCNLAVDIEIKNEKNDSFHARADL